MTNAFQFAIIGIAAFIIQKITKWILKKDLSLNTFLTNFTDKGYMMALLITAVNIIVYVLPKKLTIYDDVDNYVRLSFYIWPTFLDVSIKYKVNKYFEFVFNIHQAIIMICELMIFWVIFFQMIPFVLVILLINIVWINF